MDWVFEEINIKEAYDKQPKQLIKPKFSAERCNTEYDKLVYRLNKDLFDDKMTINGKIELWPIFNNENVFAVPFRYKGYCFKLILPKFQETCDANETNFESTLLNNFCLVYCKEEAQQIDFFAKYASYAELCRNFNNMMSMQLDIIKGICISANEDCGFSITAK